MARHRGDFGENFVEKERQFRFRKNLANNRAKSEVGEIVRQKNGFYFNFFFLQFIQI